MKKKYVLKAESMKITITPFGFRKYANDYFVAGEIWLEKQDKEEETTYSPVPYFSYCRAIELGLKAYLLAKGKSIKWIKTELRHDLKKALKHAKQNSLEDLVNTSNKEELEIEIANIYYDEKGFEYFFFENHVTGLKDLPNLEIIRKYSEKLIRDINDFINGKV